MEIAAPQIWIPRYASPKRPDGIVPPSPPAESRERKWRDFLRDRVSYRGSLEVPVDGVSRVIRPRLNLADLTRVFLRGLGGMTGMVGEGGKVDAAFGPMGANSNSGNGGDFTDPSAGWRLEGLTDATPNSNTLTNNGGVTFVAAKINNGASFPGSTSVYLSAPSTTSLQITTGHSFSLSLWVNLASSGLNTFVEKGPNTQTTAEYLVREAFGNIRVDVGDGNASNSVVIGAMGTGAWHLICFNVVTGGANTTNGYIDNVAGTPGSWGGGGVLLNAAGNLLMGKRDDGQPTNGVIDSVWLWNNYALTTGNVATLWNGGNGAEPV